MTKHAKSSSHFHFLDIHHPFQTSSRERTTSRHLRDQHVAFDRTCLGAVILRKLLLRIVTLCVHGSIPLRRLTWDACFSPDSTRHATGVRRAWRRGK